MRELKATQVRDQCCLIREITLYEFSRGHKTVEAIKNPCCSQGDVDHSTEAEWFIAKSDGAVEYTDCFSAERQDLPQWVSWYDAKQSDGEVPVMLELWGMWSTPSLP